MRATRGAGRTRLRAGGRHKGVSGSYNAGRVLCCSVPGAGRGERPQVTVQWRCSFPSGELIWDKGAGGSPSASHRWWGSRRAPHPASSHQARCTRQIHAKRHGFIPDYHQAQIHHCCASRQHYYVRSVLTIDSRSTLGLDHSLLSAFGRLEMSSRWNPPSRPPKRPHFDHPCPEDITSRLHGGTAAGNRSRAALRTGYGIHILDCVLLWMRQLNSNWTSSVLSSLLGVGTCSANRDRPLGRKRAVEFAI